MFQDFTMHPNEMNFACREVLPEIFNRYFEITTSHADPKIQSLARLSSGWCMKLAQTR